MELLEAALARPEAERDSWLESACRGDGELLREVHEALDWERRMSGFLQTPVAVPAERQADPERIGKYEIVRRLGEGGMGVVYHARQTHPIRRDIALKVVRPGMDSRPVIARFESERQALAMMDHPNIARVLEAGATPTGEPYFAMSLVDGTAITDYCDAHRLSVRERLALFVAVTWMAVGVPWTTCSSSGCGEV